jgi:predicted transcriptional regulator
MPRTTVTVTISLDPAMAKQVERLRRVEHRTNSELWREAMRAYLRARTRPEYRPTASEQRAINRGERAIRRGDYLTLDDLRTLLVHGTGRKTGSQSNRSRSTSRTRTARPGT